MLRGYTDRTMNANRIDLLIELYGLRILYIGYVIWKKYINKNGDLTKPTL